MNVDSYTPNVVREENSTRVDAGMLVLAGNYISLVKLLDFVEKDNTLGKVTSVTFQVFPDRVRKSKQLKMTIWIQQLSVVWHD